MFNPTRDGCRGGRDKFNWEELRNDRHRQNYLGNSVRVPGTRGKDVFWYEKDKQGNTSKDKEIQRELAEQKEKEAKMMGLYLQKGFGAKLPDEDATGAAAQTSLYKESLDKKDDKQSHREGRRKIKEERRKHKEERLKQKEERRQRRERKESK
jgi:hypothetical protein